MLAGLAAAWVDGQIAGLHRRKRVDLERGTVTVTEQLLEVNGAFSVGPPKSAAGRCTVTLPAMVVDANRLIQGG